MDRRKLYHEFRWNGTPISVKEGKKKLGANQLRQLQDECINSSNGTLIKNVLFVGGTLLVGIMTKKTE